MASYNKIEYPPIKLYKINLISFADPSFTQVFLRFVATLLLGYCGVRTVTELVQLLQRKQNYLKEIENYMEILLIISTAIFATAGHAENCFCYESFAWQFGALAVFLAWIDLVLYLKKLPLTGIPINMLQTVVLTFLKLIYLPIILIIAFAIPLYMLFSRVSNYYIAILLVSIQYEFFTF